MQRWPCSHIRLEDSPLTDNQLSNVFSQYDSRNSLLEEMSKTSLQDEEEQQDADFDNISMEYNSRSEEIMCNLCVSLFTSCVATLVCNHYFWCTHFSSLLFYLLSWHVIILVLITWVYFRIPLPGDFNLM